MLDVPVIDLSTRHDGLGARRDLARRIDTACSEIGFFAVTGHGVDPALCREAFAATRAFFALPLDAKLRCVHAWPNVSRGYVRLGGEAQAYANGEETLPDLSETFSVGVEPIPDDDYHRDGARFFPPNVWPTELPRLRDTILAYQAACDALAIDLMRLCALALGLDEEFFTDKVDRSIDGLRANHYPALDGPPLPGQFRGGGHTDYGSLTLLATDGKPGLEICDADGRWSPVPHVEDGFVVNIADLLQHWTCGRWRSTLHRVVASGPFPQPARLSIVFFQCPNWDVAIEPIASGETGGALPEPIQAGAFLEAKLARLYVATD